MGHFDFFSLVNALVAGAVLLGVAQLIVTYVAMYALGLSSELYLEYMRESVNWRKEYARFAAQSLVAGSTFMKYDSNESDALDRREIYKYLMEIFSGDKEEAKILDRQQVACLTDFLMRHGEMKTNVSRGRLEDVGIHLLLPHAYFCCCRCQMCRSAPSIWQNGWTSSQKRKCRSSLWRVW